MSKSKLLSLIVAGLYPLIIYLGNNDIPFAAMSLFGLVCIWVGDKKGGRRKTIPGLQITLPSSGFMMRFGGWLFLLLPLILFILAKMTGNK